MRFAPSTPALLALALALLAAPPPAARAEGEPELAGPLTRAEIEAAVPDWAEAYAEAEPEPEEAARLAWEGPDAEVTVYLGTWCSDSRRELSRLWRALDEAPGPPAFELSYLGLVRDPEARPGELVERVDLRYVPTFVVERDGAEVGRIVESSPGGIERDLAALLAGERSGLITGRDDLGPEAEAPAEGEVGGTGAEEDDAW